MAAGFCAAWPVVRLSLILANWSLLIFSGKDCSLGPHDGHRIAVLMNTLRGLLVALAALAWTHKKLPFG
jgi:hypothetical protein